MGENYKGIFMNPTPQKPREFNLEFSDLCYDDWDCKVTVDKGTDANVESYEKIRVIEKSYATRLEEALKIARAALNDCLEIEVKVTKGTFGNFKYHSGTAEQALADIERILGGK